MKISYENKHYFNHMIFGLLLSYNKFSNNKT